MTDPNRQHPLGTPTKDLIPKSTPVGLYAAIAAAVLAVIMITIAVVDVTTDPVDDGLDNIDRTTETDG